MRRDIYRDCDLHRVPSRAGKPASGQGGEHISTPSGPRPSGKLRALGVTRLERSPLLPSVPALDEQGIKGYEVAAWAGFVAPARTPPEIVGRLNAELIKIFASAETKQTLEPQGFDLSPPLTPAAFTKLVADDLTFWVPVVKASRAKAD
jgi:tripartite-type tricarboxylate transporter receptor subunit TctC